MTEFIRSLAPEWVAKNYCRVFVLPNPDAPSAIWGYYTLSPAMLVRSDLSTQHQKRAIPGIPVPLMRIGFMGRDDRSPKGLGAGLVTDAARRVHRNPDVAAWGLILDSERGEENPGLMRRYTEIGFRSAKSDAARASGVMYAPLKSLIPELNPR